MSEEENISKKISSHEFYFEIPLYEAIKIKDLDIANILRGEVDGYNQFNNYDTTFKIYSTQVDSFSWENFFKITLTCKRSENELYFFIFKNKDVIVKVGQFPSLADIQFAEIDKKYNGIMEDESLREFKKAIGLAAHGVGAGSFVYLRRIFEKLIWNAFEENKSVLGISDENFLKQRMTEKVETLKDYLPSQLVEMKSVYGILSKGVHELDEQECLSFFPALKLSIELILDQKIEQDLKKKRDEVVKKQINEISQKIN